MVITKETDMRVLSVEVEVAKKTKKGQVCSWCGGMIMKGETFETVRLRVTERGIAKTVSEKLHPECTVAASTLSDVPTFVFGEYRRGTNVKVPV